jgi:hypothetical protein
VLKDKGFWKPAENISGATRQNMSMSFKERHTAKYDF